jgi:hypothetical protein
MIVLVNVKITEHRLVNSYKNGVRHDYPTTSRFDVFKYTLSSYSVFSELVSKFVFYIEISNEFIHRKEELENFIYENFPKDKLILKWYRNNYIKDWRNVYDEISEINDDIIWLACNDDHVFLDSSLDVLKDGIDILTKDSDPLSVIYYSHWLEGIRIANHYNGVLHENGNFVKYQWSIFDGALILKKERFRKYWFEYDDDGRLWFKPDVFHDVRPPMISTFYMPTKEIVRHFDGYGHIGNFANVAPSLCVPHGFFENNIKIKYGYPQRFDDHTNINPKTNHLYSVDINGTDYKWSINDIPLFWKDKINVIDICPDSNDEELKIFRNLHYLLMAKSCNYSYLTYFPTKPPIEWFDKHMIS